MKQATSPRERLFALAEVTGFVALALISKYILEAFIWKYAGPVSLIGLLILITIYMRFRGMRWSQMGLVPLPGIKAKLMTVPKALLIGLCFFALCAALFIGLPALGFTFMQETPEGINKRFGEITGSVPHYLLWLGIVWTAAAFGEEMFFRGFLISRLQTAFVGWPLGSALAVILPALLFGFGHMYYQGLRGFISTGAIAILFGTFFLLYKRNLWPLILWHGLFDTLTMTALFLDLDA